MSGQDGLREAAAALSRSPLFKLLGRVELAKLAGELEEISLMPGEVLFRQGDAGDAFFVVRSGQAQVYRDEEPEGGPPILVGPGQVIGEMAILTGEPRSASIRAYNPLTLWRMAGTRFLSVIDRERQIALSIERALSMRLAGTLHDAAERRRELHTLTRLALRLLDAAAARLLVRLSVRPRWPEAALMLIRRDESDAVALERLIEAEILRAEGRDLVPLPSYVGSLRSQIEPEDLAWLRALAGELAAAGQREAAVGLQLAIGDAQAAAQFIADQAEELRTSVSAVTRDEWIAEMRRAGVEEALIEAAAERLGLGTDDPAEAAVMPSVPSLETGAGAGASLLRRLASAKPASVALGAALLAIGWLAPVPEGLSRPAFAALMTIGASLPLMLSEVLPAYVTTIILAAALVVPGIVAPSVALSGFASSSWLMIVILFSISSAIARSGLMYRLALMLLQRLPGNLLVQACSLFGLSMVLATGVASGNARVALAAPAVRDLAEAMGLARHSRGSAFLGLVTFQLFAEMGSLFVTGSATCLLLHGLLPEPYRSGVTWSVWFTVSLLPHLTLFLLYVPTLLLIYRPRLETPVNRTRIGIQLELLGKPTRNEMLSVLALAMLAIGFSTRAYHGVADVWTTLGTCVMLFVFRVLDDRSFQGGVNWGMMIYYGVLMGLGTVLSGLEVDQWMTVVVGSLVEGRLDNPYLFVFMLAAGGSLARLIVPWTTLTSMLALVTIPLAISVGYHPLIPVLVLLIATDHTFFPVINEAYFTHHHASEGYMFEQRQAMPALWAEAGLRIVALTASVPAWQWMGLL